MVLAFLTMSPIGSGIHLHKAVKKVIDVIKRSGLKYELGAMGTTIEAPDLSTLFQVVQDAETTLFSEGFQRVVFSLKVDDRKDKKASISSKINSVL